MEPVTPPLAAAAIICDAAASAGCSMPFDVALQVLKLLGRAPVPVRLELVGWLLPSGHGPER